MLILLKTLFLNVRAKQNEVEVNIPHGSEMDFKDKFTRFNHK